MQDFECGLTIVVCIDYQGKKHAWSLSRGTYHTASGIPSRNAQLRTRRARSADKGTFGFCARAFLGEGDSTSGNVVTLEDEFNTSKKCWTTRGAKRRRGGWIEAPLAQETRIDEEEKKKRIRHAVCRGLLFCRGKPRGSCAADQKQACTATVVMNLQHVPSLDCGS
jgi:hypothetical protein